MEDGAPAHKAKEQQNVYEEFGERKLPWPGNSSDLNPIEHVWDLLKSRIDLRKPLPLRLVDLKRAWHEKWDKLTLTEMNSFIEKPAKTSAASGRLWR